MGNVEIKIFESKPAVFLPFTEIVQSSIIPIHCLLLCIFKDTKSVMIIP